MPQNPGIKKGSRFFVVLPNFSRAELKKDDIIPEYFNKLGYQTFIFCNRPPRKTDLKTKLLKLSFRNVFKYLKEERGSKQVLLFYFVPYNIKFLLFFLLAKLLNPRSFIVIKTDGVPVYDEYSVWEKYARGVEAKLLYPFLVDLVITETPEYKDYILKMFGWGDLEDKIAVVPNGADLKNYRLRKRNRGYKSVFYVGSLSVPKGTHLLLQAFATLKDRYPDWRLVLIGSTAPGFGRELKRYEKIIEDQLEVKGFLTGKELYQEFVDGDIYVFPSFTHKEGFNFALLKAMASKNAVIGADKELEGVGYALDYGKAGLLFKKGDVGHLTELLSLLMGDEKLRKKMANAAYRRAVDIFSWEKILGKLVNLFY